MWHIYMYAIYINERICAFVCLQVDIHACTHMHMYCLEQNLAHRNDPLKCFNSFFFRHMHVQITLPLLIEGYGEIVFAQSSMSQHDVLTSNGSFHS